MDNALIYSPGFDGHRQIYVFVLAHILNELGYFVYIAGNTEQKVSNLFYINELRKWASVKIIDTSKYPEGGLNITYSQFLELQNRLSVDITILPEADHHLELLASQIPKKKKRLRGRLLGIFLRPFYFYQHLGTLDTLRYIKHLPSRWKIDERLFHEFLLDRFSLLDNAIYIDENYVQQHPRRVWIPDMFQQYADTVDKNDTADQRIWIEKLDEFKRKNSDRFLFLYFGTAQYRRGYDIVLKMAVEYDGCFIHCGLQNNKEKFIYDTKALRASLDKKGALFETNQYIEDPLCVESFFGSVTHLILPYRNFYGSSGVMLQALSYGIPILAPNTGIIGHRIKEYGLGLIYNAEDTSELYSQFDKLRATDPLMSKNKIENYMLFQTAENLKKCLVQLFTANGEIINRP